MIYEILVIVGLIWFLSILPLILLWAFFSPGGVKEEVLWGLIAGGFLFSPILMLVGGYIGRASASDLASLGISAGYVALIFSLMFIMYMLDFESFFENHQTIWQIVGTILALIFSLAGLAVLALGIYGLFTPDVDWGIGIIALGIAFTILGLVLTRAAYSGNDEIFDWVFDEGSSLLGLAAIIFGISIGIGGIIQGIRLHDWFVIAVSVLWILGWGYRGLRLL